MKQNLMMGVTVLALLVLGCVEVPDELGGREWQEKVHRSAVAEESGWEKFEEEQPLGPVTAPLYEESELYRVADVPSVDCTSGGCQTEGRHVFSNLSPEERHARIAALAYKDRRDKENRRNENQEVIDRRTERALSRIDELAQTSPEGEMLQVLVHLEDEDFDFERLRIARSERATHERMGRSALAEAARAQFKSIVDERRAQLEKKNSTIERTIEAMGGAIVARRTSANIVEVSIPPSKAARLLGEHDVLGIEIDEANLVAGADGNGRRMALGLPPGGALLYSNGEGFLGGTQGHPGGGVHVGIIETELEGTSNLLNTSHPAFKDFLGESRVVDTEMCKLRGLERKCKNSASSSSGSHGTAVAGILLGDLTEGQDPYVTSLGERVQRSGIARRAEFTYYVAHNGSWSNIATAIEAATYDDDVDIINMSFGEGIDGAEDWCSNEDHGGAREAIRAAENAGVLSVALAGNNGPGTCTFSSLATIPDTLAVGGTENVVSLTGLATVPVWAGSSRGTFPVTLNGGKVVTARIPDLVANVYGKLFPETFDGNGRPTYYPSDIPGTSFAAPQVAGAAVLLKNWLYNYFLEDDYGSIPYALRAFLAVMGDGASATVGQPKGHTVDSTTGFGHLRFVDLKHEIHSSQPEAPKGKWGFGGGKPLVLTEGEMHQWHIGGDGPEPSGLNGWKFAALIDYDYYDNGPDVKFQLIDRCPAGGGEQIVKTASSAPLKARIRMNLGEMPTKYHGRCLWMRATAEHLPNSTVKIWAIDYSYANVRVEHDM